MRFWVLGVSGVDFHLSAPIHRSFEFVELGLMGKTRATFTICGFVHNVGVKPQPFKGQGNRNSQVIFVIAPSQ